MSESSPLFRKNPLTDPAFLANRSPMERLALTSVQQGLSQEAILAILNQIPKKRRLDAFYDWAFMGRPDQQLPEGDWLTWLVSAGRGNGKTRTGGNSCKTASETTERIAFVGATAADVRDVMIEGESGLLAQYPKSERPVYIKSSRCVRFHNGARGFCYSAEQPNRLRGPQHGFAWCDEPAAWKDPKTVFANLKMGLRLGKRPRAVLTTTPKKIPFIKELFADALDPKKRVVITRGKTTDNLFSLTQSWFDEMYALYGDTRLGRQELDGELLEEVEALFQEGWILRRPRPPSWTRQALRSMFKRIIVSADPSGSSSRRSDEYGIIVAAVGFDDCGYVLADLSGKMSPDEGGRRVVQAFDDYAAHEIIGETNYGADTLKAILTLIRRGLPFKEVRSYRDKEDRALPVASLYEKKTRIFHLGTFPELEEEMTSWNPQDKTKSPGRLDAMVWAFKELICDHVAAPSYTTSGLRIVRSAGR